LFVQAVKRTQVEPFARHPQQSDYTSAWNRTHGKSAAPPAASGLEWWTSRQLPYVLRRHILGAVQRWRWDTFGNRRHFRRWNQSGRPPRV
jgi:hypothetical protein